MTVTASAPGKLILIGEYAVLFGAPAAVMAVNRRASVRIDQSADDRCRVEAPGMGWEPELFALEPGGDSRWQSPEGADRYRLLDRILREIGGTVAPLRVTLDTREFFRGGRGERTKLGLGSSAALTVALASAVATWSDKSPRSFAGVEWLRHLLRIHRGFQGGRGSGIDLAASLMGGVVEYRLDSNGAVAGAQSFQLPAELRLVVVWTGAPAETGGFLRRLDAELATADRARPIEQALGRLSLISSAGVVSLRHGEARTFLDQVDAFADAMEALGEAAGLPIMSPEHHELRRLAAAVGVRYKPSGAGGGDIGTAFACDDRALERYRSEAARTGFEVLDISPESEGLRLTNRP